MLGVKDFLGSGKEGAPQSAPHKRTYTKRSTRQRPFQKLIRIITRKGGPIDGPTWANLHKECKEKVIVSAAASTSYSEGGTPLLSPPEHTYTKSFNKDNDRFRSPYREDMGFHAWLLRFPRKGGGRKEPHRQPITSALTRRVQQVKGRFRSPFKFSPGKGLTPPLAPPGHCGPTCANLLQERIQQATVKQKTAVARASSKSQPKGR